MKIQSRLLLTLLLAALASAAAVITAAPTASDTSAADAARTLTAADAEVRTLVFAGGDSISKFYRIPAVVTLPDGTIVAVADRRLDSNADLPGRIDVVSRRSTDGGRTWEAVPVAVDTDGDESKMAELADHSLLMSIRNRRQHFRKFARSTDGGRSWTAVEKSSTLPDPAINGDIITLPDGTLIHSICNSPDTRTRVSLYKSADNAASWQRMAEVCPGGSAYSALTLLDGGRTLGVMTEEDSADGTGFRIWFTTFNLEKLLGEK